MKRKGWLIFIAIAAVYGAGIYAWEYMPGFIQGSTMHLPTRDPERCLAIEVSLLKTREHHFDKKGRPLGYSYGDLGDLWLDIFQYLPDDTLEDLAFSLNIVAMVRRREINKIIDDPKVLKDLKKARRQARQGKLKDLNTVLHELDKRKKKPLK